jgi:hypothetical protein
MITPSQNGGTLMPKTAMPVMTRSEALPER